MSLIITEFVALLALLSAPSLCLSTTIAKCTNLDDCTDELQQALDTPGLVVVPKMDTPWIVRPLFLRTSNQVLRLEDGVLILAKKDEFHKTSDCLMKAEASAPIFNVTISGWGATLRMRKLDYTDRKNYVYSEWRHGLSLGGVSSVEVVGLTIASTGGDGIYVDQDSKNLLISDVTCDDNYRQGMSVIWASNLLVVRSTFMNTNGTAPQAGVDLEPDGPEMKLSNVVFQDCRAIDNSGCGFQVWLAQMNMSTAPVSITFDGCGVDGAKDVGFRESYPQGQITFRRGLVENTVGPGIMIGKPATSPHANVMIDSAMLQNTSTGSLAPICIPSSSAFTAGGVNFEGVRVNDTAPTARDFLSLDCDSPSGQYASNIQGTFDVYTSTGKCSADLGPDPSARTVDVQFNCHHG